MPSLLLAVGEALGAGVKVVVGVDGADTVALGVGVVVVAVTFPAFQSVATNKTIGETSESS